MNDQNIDVNLIIQSFQERISQLITEVVVKEATIKQLLSQTQRTQPQLDDFETPTETAKKVK
jgi:hypothetical protein